MSHSYSFYRKKIAHDLLWYLPAVYYFYWLLLTLYNWCETLLVFFKNFSLKHEIHIRTQFSESSQYDNQDNQQPRTQKQQSITASRSHFLFFLIVTLTGVLMSSVLVYSYLLSIRLTVYFDKFCCLAFLSKVL